MDALSASLGRTPEFFPYAVDSLGDGISFIRLSRDDYARASFLDARIVKPGHVAHAVPWATITALIDAAGLAERCHFIFHIGHVGSTLLSRLVGADPRAFALREPAILRRFAQRHAEAAQAMGTLTDANVRMGTCLRLLSRTFDPGQSAVIKATSFVSELAVALLARNWAPRAVMMYVPPESYLATIFGGPNSRQEAKLLTPWRLRRLHRRIGREVWRIDSLSEGETVALGWVCEMAALAEPVPTARDRILKLDFDAFLAAPFAHLSAVLRHFDIPATEHEIRDILAGPHLHRYSKAPEHAYDAALRAEVLSLARSLHGAEIRRGLRWLERAAEHECVHAALRLGQPG
jgi:hypothetical protein